MADIGLFQNSDRSPMIFCLRPCSIKKKVRQLIVNGGGFCFPSLLHVPPHYRGNAIPLVPDGEVIVDENALHASYIIDCAREGRLLPRASYSRNEDGVVEIDEEYGGRAMYTRTEDTHILLYVKNRSSKNPNLNGNAFWKKLESENFLQLQGRSWQSLRDRYLKYLRGKESQYSLEAHQLEPIPLPPERIKSPKYNEENHAAARTPSIDSQPKSSADETVAENVLEGTFLAQIEARRDALSPGLSPKEYDALIGDFVTSMKKETNLDSDSILKILFNCNGNEDIARHYIRHGVFPEGFKMMSVDTDKLLLKCLLNPNICDEEPARQLAEELGENVVLDRAAALIGVSRADYEYMQKIPYDLNQ